MSSALDRFERSLVAASRELHSARQRQADGRTAGRSRLRLSWVLPALSIAISLAVAAAFIDVQTPSHITGGRLSSGRELELVYRVEATAASSVSAPALRRTIEDLNRRLAAIPHSRARITSLAGDLIKVRVSTSDPARVQAAIGQPAQLVFYDWEADTLLPNGKPVASALAKGTPLARRISQGTAADPPGSLSQATGAMTLYEAAMLASRQPYRPATDNSRFGTEYYLFGAPGSRACMVAARAAGRPTRVPQHCLLAGPLDLNPHTTTTAAVQKLEAGLPEVERAGSRVLAIKQGTIVVQGTSKNPAAGPALGTASARYYVLRDHVALSGNQITAPHAGIGPSGQPTAQFSLTHRGTLEFKRLTAGLARRGELASTGSQRLLQHFAAVLDNQLITVPAVDYAVYPDGITGPIYLPTGSTASANQLARLLRIGALPLKLRLLDATNG